MDKEKDYEKLLDGMRDRMTGNEFHTFIFIKDSRMIGACIHCGAVVYTRKGEIFSNSVEACYCNGRKQ